MYRSEQTLGAGNTYISGSGAAHLVDFSETDSQQKKTNPRPLPYKLFPASDLASTRMFGLENDLAAPAAFSLAKFPALYLAIKGI